MPIYLKQSTASQEIPLGIFVDSTTGNTEMPSLTIANTDIKLWKAGATTLASKNSGGATYISNGIYYCVLDATDTDTLGSLVVFIHVATALAVKVECVVLAANIYDSLIGGTDLLDVSAAQVAGQTASAAAGVTFPSSIASPTNITAGVITTTTNLTNAPTAGDFTATMKTSLNNATPAVTVSDKTGFSLSAAGIQAIWDRLTSALTTVGSIGKLLVDNINATISSRSTYAGGDTSGTTTLLTRIPGTVQPQTGDSYARLGAPVGASISADVAGVQSDTDNIQTRIPAALVSGRMDSSVGAMATDSLSSAAVSAAAVTKIQAGLSTYAGGAVASVTGNVGGNVNGSVGSVASGVTVTTNNDKTGYALTTGERVSIADAVLDRDMAIGTDSGGRTVRNALRLLRNKVAIALGTMTIYKEDDIATAWTAVVTTDAAADPITAVDP